MVIIIIIISLIIPWNAFTQVSDDLNYIMRYNQIIPAINDSAHSAYQEVSEVKLLAQNVIRLYRKFISSQHDKKRTCVFTPGCSQFSLIAIKKYGIVYGVLMTSDRLQRCNNFGIKNYHIHDKTGKFHDPVFPYYLKIF